MWKRKKGAGGRAETTSFLRFRSSADALKSHVRKLRKSDPAHVREIANSISTLGFNVPLLVGKDNVVVDGNSRRKPPNCLACHRCRASRRRRRMASTTELRDGL
jgi:hypothetical protein